VREAQPFDGITRHYELDNSGSAKYRGYSVHSRESSLHYDEGGRPDGRTEHRADGSLAWDANGEYKGRSIDSGNTTRAYDEKENYKGLSTRIRNRIHHYDEHGKYTGYTIFEPAQGPLAVRDFPLRFRGGGPETCTRADYKGEGLKRSRSPEDRTCTLGSSHSAKLSSVHSMLPKRSRTPA
jgi:hypothetical protein